MPSPQPPKVAELKDISERLVEAIALRPKIDADTVRAFLVKARQKDLDQLGEARGDFKEFLGKDGRFLSDSKRTGRITHGY